MVQELRGERSAGENRPDRAELGHPKEMSIIGIIKCCFQIWDSSHQSAHPLMSAIEPVIELPDDLAGIHDFDEVAAVEQGIDDFAESIALAKVWRDTEHGERPDEPV
jgi:hypothetical protein